MTVKELKEALANIPDEYEVQVCTEGLNALSSVEVNLAYTITEWDYRYEQDGFWPNTTSPRMMNMGKVPGSARPVFHQGEVWLQG